MNKKKYEKCCEHRIFKCLTWIIIGLIALMLIVVILDRCAFHKKVYDIAISEINGQKKACATPNIIDSLKNQKHYIDTITSFQQTYASSYDAGSDEDFSSIIEVLKNTDGLINGNGITFLISLIVALLISLVSDRVIAMEELMSRFHELSTETMKYTKDMPQIMKLNSETQKEIQRFREKNTTFYIHTTNFNNVLNRIESLYNHAIQIDNTISSGEINEKTSEVVGLLGSRINLISDEIIDRFNNSKLKLDFITTDEKSILETYIDDTLLCIQENLKEINKKRNDVLSTIIQDKIYLVEDIRDIIGTIEVREEIYT